MGTTARHSDSESDSQEESPPSEELGSPEQVDEAAAQPAADDIPVAVVEVFLSQDEVKLREVHSPTKQDLTDLSAQARQTEEVPAQQIVPTSAHLGSDQGTAATVVPGGQDAPDGFYTTEDGFVTGEVPTLEGVVAGGAASNKGAFAGLVSSSDNAFAKALMSSDEALVARKKVVTSPAAGNVSKRKSNPMCRE